MNADEVHRRWAERTGEYSPDYYAYYGPDETSEQVRAHLAPVLDADAAILELGCSSGRHLAHLHDDGYENLHGIDVNDDAFDVMADAYPDLATDGTFYVDAIENVVGEFADGQFDAVFSVETLQHVPPDNEWVFEELARITSQRLVTVENEGGSNAGDGDGTDRDSDDAGSAASADDPDVNYLNDLPLYYRAWNRIFTELGFVEVDSEPTTRDTLRVFRPARE